MSLQGRVTAYNKLNQANDLALEHLAVLSGRGEDWEDAGKQLYDTLGLMTTYFVSLLTEESPFYQGLAKWRFEEEIMQKCQALKNNVIKGDSKGLTHIVDDSDAYSPVIRDAFQQYAVRSLAVLNPNLEGDFLAEEVSIEDLETPHDLIRYMHRVASDLFFDPNGEKWYGVGEDQNARKYMGCGLTLCAMAMDANSIDAYFEKNPAIQRIKEICDTKRFKGMSKKNQILYGLVGDQILSLQLPLGCHYATLQFKEEEDQHRIRFKFTNTKGYQTSEFREDLSEEILIRLGYGVQRNKNIFHVDETFKTLEEALDNFENLLRFSVSLYDVDCLDTSVGDRLEDAVNSFFAGQLNLKTYLSNPEGKAPAGLGGENIGEQLVKVTKEMKKISPWKKLFKETKPYMTLPAKGLFVLLGLIIGGAVGAVYAYVTDPEIKDVVHQVEHHDPLTYSSLTQGD